MIFLYAVYILTWLLVIAYLVVWTKCSYDTTGIRNSISEFFHYIQWIFIPAHNFKEVTPTSYTNNYRVFCMCTSKPGYVVKLNTYTRDVEFIFNIKTQERCEFLNDFYSTSLYHKMIKACR